MPAYKIPDNVFFQEVNGEAVLLSLQGGFYYGLDEVGTTIWQLIGEEQLDPDQVVERLTEIYEVEAEQARNDLGEFLDDLRESGLIPLP